MAFNERIRVLFDVDTVGGVKSLKGLRDSVKDADGSIGKMKAGLSGLGGMLKENIAGAAVAAGTALVAFGVKAVGAFQDTALAAGKFADATGVTVEEASRFLEVAGDIGVSSESLQGAFQRLNKAVADGKPSLERYGVEVVRTADGMVDANATFINAATTVGAIVDPTKRAQAAQELFGKSYAEVSELMEMSAGELKTALDGVSDAKVIDEGELKRAREFRDQLDNLKDIFEDVSLAVGEAVVPALTDMAEALVSINDAASALTGGDFGQFLSGAYDISPIAQTTDAINALDAAISGLPLGTLAEESVAATVEAVKLREEERKLAEAAAKAGQEAAALAKDIRDDRDAMIEAARETRGLDAAYRALTGQLDNREAWLNLLDSLDGYRAKMAEGTLTARQQEQATIDLRQELISYLVSLDDVPATKQTEILSLIDQGEYDRVKAMLDLLAAPRAVKYVPRGEIGYEKREHGGPVRAGVPYVVGEKRPELFVPSQNGTIVPKVPAGVGGGGTTIIVNGARSSIADRQFAEFAAHQALRSTRRRP